MMESQSISGKYQILETLGQGGMGTIYRGIHTALNRPVAIKVLHPQFADNPSFLARFQREARAMARLDHEHVIRVFDVGENQGAPYIVMEFFPGKDLRRLILERGKFSMEESLAMILQAADALSYLHRQGIVHRDIKPANIMVDDCGKVKLADLGIAMAANEASVTATGQIIGTPEYMSPEQAKGEALDGRSDLYSLGMVLYKMITGQTPVEGLSQMAILGKLLYNEEWITSFSPEVPASLQKVIRSLLKKQQGDRTPDANTLIVHIKALGIAGESGSKPAAPSRGSSPGEEQTLFPEEAPSPSGSLGSRAPGAPPLPFVQPSSPRPGAASGESARSVGSTPAPAPIKRRATYVIAGAAFIVILAGVVLASLFLMKERPSLPPPLSEGEKNGSSVFPDQLLEAQKSSQEVKDRLLVALSEANAADADRWAPKLYLEASELGAKGVKAIQEAGNLIDQKEYGRAVAALQEARISLARANEGFIKARETALARISKEQTAEEKGVQEEKGRLDPGEVKKRRSSRAKKDQAESNGEVPSPEEEVVFNPPTREKAGTPVIDFSQRRSEKVIERSPASGMMNPEEHPSQREEISREQTSTNRSGLKVEKPWYEELGTIELPRRP